MNLKKEQFYKDAAMFFESGILKELYSSDNLSICNISNQCYGAFSYIKTNEGQICILINTEHVKPIIENNLFLNKLVVNMDEKTLESRTIPLNAKSYQLMQQLKNKNDVAGPTKSIDLQMEEEIMKKNRTR